MTSTLLALNARIVALEMRLLDLENRPPTAAQWAASQNDLAARIQALETGSGTGTGTISFSQRR